MFGIELNVLIGNFCSFVAMCMDSIGSSRKTARLMLFFQSLSQIAMATGAIFFGAYAAAVQNGVSFFRNMRAATNKGGKWLEWVFLAIAVLVGTGANFLLENKVGYVIGMLPVVANVGYSLAVYFFSENEFMLKLAFILTNVVFGFFNFKANNYVGLFACTVVTITTSIFLIKSRKRAKAATAEPEEGKESVK